MNRAVALCVVLAASASAAEDDRPRPQPRRNFLIPAIETELFHLAFLAFNNFGTGEGFAQVSLDAFVSHFDGRRPWTIDVDYFETNQIGHPYQGALSFTAARSSGLSFWWASLYAFLGSLTWELFYEVDAPSANDQITTSVGGAMLGEVLHRGAALILSQGLGRKSLARQLFAVLVEPAGSLNRWLLGGQLSASDVDEGVPHFGYLSAGANVAGHVRDSATLQNRVTSGTQVNLQAQLSYGLPGDPDFRYSEPFSHFDLNANVSFPGLPIIALFIRGMLTGSHYTNESGSVRGVWGLFGQFDFAQPALVRASAVGFGPGTSLQWRFSERGFLQLGAVLSFSPLGAAGNLGLDENKFRDYHTGPGAQGVVELRLIHRDAGMIRLVGREWFIGGLYTEQRGYESVSYVTFGVLARLGGPFAAGVDFVGAIRAPHFEDDHFNRAVDGSTLRITLNYLTDEHFGTVVPERPPAQSPGSSTR